MPQVGRQPDVGACDAVFEVEFGRADLPLDRKVALDVLLGRDRPKIILVERKGDRERLPQIEGADELRRRLRLGRQLGARDAYAACLLYTSDAADDR